VSGLVDVATDVEHVAPPGCSVAVYPVTAAPPSEAGAAQEIAAVPFPADAETFVGVLGTPTGVTADDAALADESPALFVATTVNVYAVPFVRPLHAAVTPATTHEAPAGNEVTV